MAISQWYRVPGEAWYSKRFYAEVALRWTGINGLYLFLLSGVFVLLYSIVFKLTFADGAGQYGLELSRGFSYAVFKGLIRSTIYSYIWIASIILIFVFYLLALLLCLLLSMAGIVICSLLNAELPFPAIFRISAIALTPPLILLTPPPLFIFWMIAFPVSPLLLLLILMPIGYLVFGIVSAKNLASSGDLASRSQW